MRYVLCAAAIIAALLLACGCKDNDNDKGGTCCFCGEEWGPASVQIVMYVDTLRYLPGESVCAQGFIVVKDAQQRAMPGVKVNLELTEPFGSIELLNSALQDTTNALGRVGFRFCCDGCTGDNVIHAWYGSHEDTWPIHVQPAGSHFAALDISLEPETLYWPQDSVTLSMTLTDSSHAGIPGVSLSVVANCGQLGYLSATDNSGYTRCVAHIGGCPSPWCVYWTIGGRHDSACVVILDTAGGHIR
jgi:hypothetical protein